MIASDPGFWLQSAGGGGGGGEIEFSRMLDIRRPQNPAPDSFLIIFGDVSHVMGSSFRYSVMRLLNLYNSVFAGQKSG